MDKPFQSFTWQKITNKIIKNCTSSNNIVINYIKFYNKIRIKKSFLINLQSSKAVDVKHCQKKHLPVVEWIWSNSPINDIKRKVLYGDTVISCRKAVISGGPRQVLFRRAAIPAVNLTSAFLTSAFVPARSATCRLRASHFICLCRFLSNSDLRFHHLNCSGRSWVMSQY